MNRFESVEFSSLNIKRKELELKIGSSQPQARRRALHVAQCPDGNTRVFKSISSAGIRSGRCFCFTREGDPQVRIKERPFKPD